MRKFEIYEKRNHTEHHMGTFYWGEEILYIPDEIPEDYVSIIKTQEEWFYKGNGKLPLIQKRIEDWEEFPEFKGQPMTSRDNCLIVVEKEDVDAPDIKHLTIPQRMIYEAFHQVTEDEENLITKLRRECMSDFKIAQQILENRESGRIKFLQVIIQTENVEEEIAFYEKYVGLTIQRDLRTIGKKIVFLANSEKDTCIEIMGTKGVTDAGSQYLAVGFRDDHLEEKREMLIADGFEVTDYENPIPGVKFFFAKDPAGVSVQFMK